MVRKIKEILKKNGVVILIVFTFLLYTPTLFGKFLWDDEDFVYANQYVKNFYITKFFTQNAIAGRGKISNYYRPLQLLIYSSLYKIFGRTSFFFHLTNVIIHICAGVALYLLLRKIKIPLIISFLTTLFFLIHPVQTEAVSYISGLSDPLYTLFISLSALTFFSNRFTISLLLFTLALLSKETSLTFIIILPLLVIFNYLYNHTSKTELKEKLKYTTIILLLALGYLLLRFTAFNFYNIREAWGNSIYANNPFVRFLTYTNNFFIYLFLLIYPHNLHMERDAQLKTIKTISPSFYLFLIVELIWLLINAFILKKDFKNGLIAFLGWLLFNFLLGFYSGVILLNGIFYEHFLYLALFFFFLTILSYIHHLKFDNNQLFLFFILPSYIFFLSFININRQMEWINPVKFYKQTLRFAPKSIRIKNELAMTLSDLGKQKEAIKIYKSIIKENGDIAVVHYNLGNAFFNLNLLDDAEREYKKTIKINKYFLSPYFQLLKIYTREKNTKKIKNLLKKLEFLPNKSTKIILFLATSYENIKDINKALKYYSLLLNNSPQGSKLHFFSLQKILLLTHSNR